REDADPDPSPTLDRTRHGTPSRFDLPCSKPAAGSCLEPIVAKADLVAAGRDSAVAALLLLAVFTSCGLQHSLLLLSAWRVRDAASSACRWPLRARRPRVRAAQRAPPRPAHSEPRRLRQSAARSSAISRP